ncbi:MAG: hypothetical protein ABI477_05645 [Chryseolinea sp.]
MDQDGFALYQKRLEGGGYEIPEGTTAHEYITAEELNFSLSELILKNIKLRPRYQHTINNASTV